MAPTLLLDGYMRCEAHEGTKKCGLPNKNLARDISVFSLSERAAGINDKLNKLCIVKYKAQTQLSKVTEDFVAKVDKKCW